MRLSQQTNANASLYIVLVLVLAILSCTLAAGGANSADEEKNAASSTNYTAELNAANETMRELAEQGFAVVRYNDTLCLAASEYRNQMVLLENGGTVNFGIVDGKLKELIAIRDNAFSASDELHALNSSISEFMQDSGNGNASEVIAVYSNAIADYKAERYEDALSNVDLAYKKMSETAAQETRLRAIYDASSRTVKRFIIDNTWMILGVIVSVCALALVLQTPIRRQILHTRIQALNIRSDSIKRLIAETQKEYLQKGNLSETMYHIRLKKYHELMRDIDRQIPLLNEELELLTSIFRFKRQKKAERGADNEKEGN